MPWNWPVEVNYLEAKAFCNWLSAKTGKKLRLPTEAEYSRLGSLADLPDQPYWDKAPGNINLEWWASSCPVDRFLAGGLLGGSRSCVVVSRRPGPVAQNEGCYQGRNEKQRVCLREVGH